MGYELNSTIHGVVYQISEGNTAWLLIASALVLFMTIPGLALFYSGLVREKNVIATVMQSFAITALISFLWLLVGYSLAFSPLYGEPNSYPLFGDLSQFWLHEMTLDSVHPIAPTIPESVFCMFQLTFAILTSALICGSFADRMKFWPMIIFMSLWHICVYCPLAHVIWHPLGFLNKMGVLDFAGGTVVHISSGMSGLVAAVMLGQRRGYGTETFKPHNILLCAVGAGMLWIGWFGFNGGCTFAAGKRSGYSILATHIACSVSGLSWMATETFLRKKPSLVGLVSGCVAGLVAITPASGYVNPTGGFVIGLVTGPVCYMAATLKFTFGYDDALDAFGIHAIGGAIGSLLTGFFATDAVAIGIQSGVFYAHTSSQGWGQLLVQVYAILFAASWSGIISFVLLYAIDKAMGLRVTAEEEEAGLDISLHGEAMYSNMSDHAKPLPGFTRNELHLRIGNRDHDGLILLIDKLIQENNEKIVSKAAEVEQKLHERLSKAV